jgi:hypothetical protein
LLFCALFKERPWRKLSFTFASAFMNAENRNKYRYQDVANNV